LSEEVLDAILDATKVPFHAFLNQRNEEGERIESELEGLKTREYPKAM
jgi:hypothetical protein